MMHFIDSIYKLGEAAIAKPLSVVISGFSTVLLTAALGTTEFASQYPGIMITIISTIGAFCLVLIGVIYKNQMNVNTEVLAGLKELRAEIKADKEAAKKERDEARKEAEQKEKEIEKKIEVVRQEVHKAELIQAENRNAEHINTKADVDVMRQTVDVMLNFMEQLKDVKIVKTK